ncbi:MAG: ammonium transporter, partial [Clostridiales bacterium]|nr:ammonium transporter [Clostridiales bacterium]
MGIENNLTSADVIWILIGAALVFFMQAGFAILEAGLTRAKNTGNIIMKNLFDFCLGTLFFTALGYGLMKGESLLGMIGIPTAGFFTGEIDMTALIFNTVFCATAATIVSGAMAERTKFSSYCLYSVIISAIVFPISGHWIWGGGWLASLGFHDFAGSAAVHMVGGVSALIGAKILGARIGKFDREGNPKAILGHNIVMAALGVFILWFCWFGFNGASTYGVSDPGIMSLVFVTTNMAPAAAAVTCLLITWIRYKKPDVSMCLNGVLGGLVAVTAAADTVSPFAAFIIGIAAGFVIVFACEFIEKKLKIDDPVGAVAVHGCCGTLGVLLTGILSFDSGLWGAAAGNVTWAEGFRFFGIQVLGVVVVVAWVSLVMLPVFFLLKKTIGLRVPAKEEIRGLDICEHNLATAYAGFAMDEPPAVPPAFDTDKPAAGSSEPANAPAPARKAAPPKAAKLTKISMVIRPDNFEALKAALNDIGVTGMTITEVMGCGMQMGHKEYYRGAPIEVTLLPKLKVEVVVSAVPVTLVIETAKQVLRTGQIGDGKLFVYDVEDAIKV